MKMRTLKQMMLLLLCFASTTLFTQTISTFLEDLNNPIGLEFDADQNLWVTESGTGNDDGQVTLIEPDGTTHAVITGLPSLFNPDGNDVVGPWRTYQMANDRLIVVSGEGENELSAHLLIYDLTGYEVGGAPMDVNDYESAIDIGSFVLGADYEQTNPYAVAENSDGDLFVTDAAANAVIKWEKATGDLSFFAIFEDFRNFFPVGPPFYNAVPTKILSDGADGFYVSLLTGFPFAEGAASVQHLAADGTISAYATSLTMAVDMAFDPSDGNLGILQFADFQLGAGFLPESAELNKFNMADSVVVNLARNFGPSSGLAFDDAGNAYVSNVFFGNILKIEFTSPANDALCDAVPITIGEACNDIPNINNNSATAQDNEPTFGCAGAEGDAMVRNSVWYSFEATASEVQIIAEADNVNNGRDLQLNLFALNGDCADLTNLEYIDCNAPTTNILTSASLFATLTEGSTYYIQISGQSFAANEFGSGYTLTTTGCLTINEVVSPPNDNTCDAIALELGAAPQKYSNAGATAQEGESMIDPPASAPTDFFGLREGWVAGSTLDHSVWFTFTTPPEGGDFGINAYNSAGLPGNYNTQIAVYEVGDCNDFSTYTYVTSGENGFPPPPPGSFVTTLNLSPNVGLYCAEGNKTYMIAVDGGMSFFNQASRDRGIFSIAIETIEPLRAPIIGTAFQPAICIGDEEEELVNIELEDRGIGPNRQLIITDLDANILALPQRPPFNLEGAGAGVCLIWYMSYSNVEGLEIGGNLNDLTGCFEISEPVAVERYEGEDCEAFIRPDLEMIIYADQHLYEQYESVLVTFVVTNYGAKASTGVKVDAGLPDGMVFGEEMFASQGAYNEVDEIWEVGTLEPGQSEFLDIEMFALISDEDVTVVSQVIAADVEDIDSTPDNNAGEDDEASITLSPATNGGFRTEEGETDLSINLEFDASDYANFEFIPITLTVTNDGPDDATRVVIHLPEPDNTVFKGDADPLEITHGEWIEWLGKWEIDYLESGETATLTLELFTLGEQNAISAYAEVFITNELDPDSTPGNGDGSSSNEDDEAVATIAYNSINENFNNSLAASNNPNTPDYFLYPNPTTDQIVVIHNSDRAQDGFYQILSVEGKVLRQSSTTITQGINQFEIEVSDFPQGTYLFQLVGEAGSSKSLRFAKI